MRSKTAARCELLLWTVGATCLGAFLYLHGARHVTAEAEVERFLSMTRGVDSTPSSPAGAIDVLPGETPDQTLWSEQRVQAFEAAVAAAGARSASAVLRIPALGLEAPVYEGTDEWALNRGLGRVDGTAAIGTAGNVAIAGHRDGFFRPLKEIDAADVIEVIGPQSITRYEVTDTWIVAPDAVEVLDPMGYGALTLITCFPFHFVGHAPRRFIVRAVAIEPSRQLSQSVL